MIGKIADEAALSPIYVICVRECVRACVVVGGAFERTLMLTVVIVMPSC
jgi:hypothetical protein